MMGQDHAYRNLSLLPLGPFYARMKNNDRIPGRIRSQAWAAIVYAAASFLPLLALAYFCSIILSAREPNPVQMSFLEIIINRFRSRDPALQWFSGTRFGEAMTMLTGVTLLWIQYQGQMCQKFHRYLFEIKRMRPYTNPNPEFPGHHESTTKQLWRFAKYVIVGPFVVFSIAAFVHGLGKAPTWTWAGNGWASLIIAIAFFALKIVDIIKTLDAAEGKYKIPSLDTAAILENDTIAKQI